MTVKAFALFFTVLLYLQAAGAHAFADRYYISSVLSDVFGPKANPIVLELVLKNGAVFGGPCDVYEQVRTKERTYANEERTRCFKGKQEFDYAVRGKPSLLRESWMIKTCNTLVTTKSTFSYFKNKMRPKLPYNAQTITSIREAFDPNAVSDEKMTDYYLKKMKSFSLTDDKLRFLLFEICSYPSWQLI